MKKLNVTELKKIYYGNTPSEIFFFFFDKVFGFDTYQNCGKFKVILLKTNIFDIVRIIFLKLCYKES